MIPGEAEGTISMGRVKAGTQATNVAVVSRLLPFAVFMAFIGLDEGLRLLARAGLIVCSANAGYYLYAVKTFVVGSMLYLFRGSYGEICWKELGNRSLALLSCAVGILTCVIWVLSDWTLPLVGSSAGFDPTQLPDGVIRLSVTLVRVAGAVLVVPLMEELFWRSFLLRYLVNPDFETVPLGRFTWNSFLISALLFGLEHHLFYAGVMAGIIYSLILYKTRSIAHCVLAHAVTNLALAIYVLYTGKWYFW